MKRQPQSAFTLIELLVVVAIIAILAALLFPAISPFVEKGKAADCANNLRNLGHALNLQLVEQNGTFFSKATGDSDSWPRILHRKYLKDWRAFRSPFDLPTATRPRNAETDPIPVSYGLNENLFDTFDGKWTAPRTTLILAAVAVDPSHLGREVVFKTEAFAQYNVSISPPGGTGRPVGRGLGTHERRQAINVLRADFSVAPNMEYHQFADSTTPRGKSQWFPE
jgi:prepilin-type N-terminal cleavage/methylation domain-containing protein